MGLTSHNNRYITVFFLSLLFFGIGVVESLNFNQRLILQNDLRQHAKEELSAVRFQLEAEVLADIYAVKSLTPLLMLDPELKLYHWEQLSAAVMRSSDHLRALGIAPNDVVVFSYPLSQSHAVLGLDYRTVPLQWASIKKAREIKQTFVSGPVDLVQGGKALVIREPIFYDPPTNSRYWGVLSVVMDWDSLLSSTKLQSFGENFQLSIRGRDSLGSEGEVFWGDPQVFQAAFAKETVYFPYGSWQIAVAETQGLLHLLPWYEQHIVRLIGYPILMLLLLGFGVIVRLYHVAEERSLHDPLTHLPNRRYFICTIDTYFENAKRSDSEGNFALLNIDIDRFKTINDSYGHIAGDKVLVACAERIKSCLRVSDLVARIGGDEFLVLIPRIHREQDVLKVCDTILTNISETPIVYEGQLINIRVSIGYALYDRAFADPNEMFKLADQRMYAAKRRQNPHHRF
ncbi:diguanylate cyclase [Vibrio metoecus]|uniref:Diguanylate cyclase n=1 Tax=Vibrio metoecus TaxID=1481663 RepID=A0A0Q0JU82_VIBMT|nr:diguanylate cyclase [Vibrio metoecus]KQA24459.1 diguanylate cyclase [Vibrio metoecus]MCR9388132.1 sensor domain-containing diguanylate cyclase [Vibrio metoecus]PAR48673.1 sensor domain-containing diguanylate cyclase [Vibrio metoecus]